MSETFVGPSSEPPGTLFNPFAGGGDASVATKNFAAASPAPPKLGADTVDSEPAHPRGNQPVVNTAHIRTIEQDAHIQTEGHVQLNRQQEQLHPSFDPARQDIPALQAHREVYRRQRTIDDTGLRKTLVGVTGKAINLPPQSAEQVKRALQQLTSYQNLVRTALPAGPELDELLNIIGHYMRAYRNAGPKPAKAQSLQRTRRMQRGKTRLISAPLAEHDDETAPFEVHLGEERDPVDAVEQAMERAHQTQLWQAHLDAMPNAAPAA